MSTDVDWDDEVFDGIRDLVKPILADKNPHPDDLVFVEELKDICLNPFNCHVLATPLLEFSFISFSAVSDKLERFFNSFGSVEDEIRVIVKAIGDDSNGTVLFDSDSHYGANVLFCRDGKLDINLENSKLNRPVWIPKTIVLKLVLENKSKEISMIDEFRLNFGSKVVYDKQHCLELCSRKFGLVLAHSTYFRHATFVSVDCRLEKIDDTCETEDAYADLTGSISARFMVRDQPITRVLLNQRNGDPAMLDRGELCWSLQLAVPAYSVLEILVDNLVINQDKIDTSGRTLKFKPSHQYSETVELVGQEWRFLVSVNWKHVYDDLPPLCECDCDDDAGGTQGESIGFSEFEDRDSESNEQSREVIGSSSERHQEKRPRLQSFEFPVSSANVLIPRMDPLPSLRERPLQLVEVYSISVYPYVDKVDCSFLIGTIFCRDSFGEHEVFNGNDNRIMLHPDQTISMVGPRRCYSGWNFSMRLELKDSLGRELSYGYLSWCFVTAPSWVDRRLCSIIRGKNGFAAVHYTIFYDATQARVAVSLLSEDACPHQIQGEIQARYTRYRYATQYDRKFYRSLLFKKGDDEYLSLHNGDDVPLSKFVVSVPLDESLIVIADLKLVVGGREKILKGKVEFQAQEVVDAIIRTKPLIIGKLSCGLRVSVSWG